MSWVDNKKTYTLASIASVIVIIALGYLIGSFTSTPITTESSVVLPKPLAIAGYTWDDNAVENVATALDIFGNGILIKSNTDPIEVLVESVFIVPDNVAIRFVEQPQLFYRTMQAAGPESEDLVVAVDYGIDYLVHI